MTAGQYEWLRAKNQLVDAVKQLGFPEELGLEIAKNLGSPGAMSRMRKQTPNITKYFVTDLAAMRSRYV